METAIAAGDGTLLRSTDGGQSWAARNKGTRACFMPEGQQWPEAGQCCHHLVRSPEQFEYLKKYIAENPQRARLRDGEYLNWVRPPM